jgi:hypothetical protein
MIQETQKMHYLGSYMRDMTTFVTKQKPDWSVAYRAALVWSQENAAVWSNSAQQTKADVILQ